MVGVTAIYCATGHTWGWQLIRLSGPEVNATHTESELIPVLSAVQCEHCRTAGSATAAQVQCEPRCEPAGGCQRCGLWHAVQSDTATERAVRCWLSTATTVPARQARQPAAAPPVAAGCGPGLSLISHKADSAAKRHKGV
jgi:hypothetical protein